MNFKQFCSDILILSDPEIAAQMKSYMRNKFDFLGVPAARRREASLKQFETAHEEGEIDWEFVDACWEQNFREFQYVAIDYLTIMSSFLKEEDIDLIENLITDKSWWDTVDNLNLCVGNLIKEYPDLAENVLTWSKSDNIWLRRSAIIHQLSYKENTNTELLAEIIKNNFDSDEFFIKKAIGWALREYSKTNTDWVTDFITENKQNLSSLSYREASKYIHEGE